MTSSSEDRGSFGTPLLRSVSFQDKEHELEFNTAATPSPRRYQIYSLLVGLIVATLFWSAILGVKVQHVHESNVSEDHLFHCGQNGQTPHAARDLGCKFELWTYAWVPPACTDAELEQEFLEMSDWKYFLDHEGKEEVNITTVQRGELTLFTTWGQHFWHCAFTWKRMVRAQNVSGTRLTNIDVRYGHVNHCLRVLTTKDDFEWDSINDMLTVGYRNC